MSDQPQLWQLKLTLRSLAESLAQISDQERKENPAEHFGKNYNALRQKFLELVEGVDQAFVPPMVPFGLNGYGIPVTVAKYIDILTYANQLAALLPPEELPERAR
jgi:hypothetical protein